MIVVKIAFRKLYGLPVWMHFIAAPPNSALNFASDALMENQELVIKM